MARNTAAMKRGWNYDIANSKLKAMLNGAEVASFKAATSLTRIYVDPDGDDTNGTGARLSPVATVTKAFTLVTATRKIIQLAPGDYAEAAAMTWPTTDNVQLIGSGKRVTSISATTTAGGIVLTVAPGAVSSTWDGLIKDVQIAHDAGNAQIGVKFSNASMTKKLLFTFDNVDFEADAVTDKAIDMATHSDTSNAVRIYVYNGTITGAVYFAVANNADRLQFEDSWIEGSITTVGADQLRLRLLRCIIPEDGVRVAVIANSGLQTVTIIDCKEWTDFNDTVAEIYTFPTSACVTGTTAVIVANS